MLKLSCFTVLTLLITTFSVKCFGFTPSYRGLNQEELIYVQGKNPRQLIDGILPDDVSLDDQGTLLALKNYENDPSNPDLLFLKIPSEGATTPLLDLQVLKKPKGFASAPVFIKTDTESFLISYLEPKKPGMKKGLYKLSISLSSSGTESFVKNGEWTPFIVPHPYVDEMAVSQNSEFLAIKKTNPMPGAKESLIVFKLTNGEPVSQSYSVATDHTQFYNLSFSKDSKYIFFTKRNKLISGNVVGSIFRAENIPDAKASSYTPKLSAVNSVGGKGLRISTLGSATSYELITNPKKIKVLECPINYECKILAYHPKQRKFYFSVRVLDHQKLTQASGLFVGEF